MSEKIEAEFIENFLVVWDPERGSELYRLGFYGKPIGIPKPKVTDFNVPLILDLMEGLYLVEKGVIAVTEGPKRAEYGCDFAVYKHGPGVDHAPYMVSVKKTKDEVTATEIVKTGRLATTVRKRFIIAIPDLETEKIQYLIFKWFKA